MHQIDFNTSKSLIIHYRRGGGGHFVGAALGLSNNVLLQNNELAIKQLNGTLTPLDKLDMLVNNISQVTDTWTDFGLSDDKMYGIDRNEMHLLYTALKEDPTVWRFFNNIGEITNSGKYIIHTSHPGPEIFRRLEVWPNSKVLVITNTREFIREVGRAYYIEQSPLVRDRCKQYWDIVRGADWPVDPPRELEDVADLPDFVKDELYNTFNGEIDRYLTSWHMEDHDEALIRSQVNDVFYLSALELLDTDATVNVVKDIYKWMGLTDFDSNMCKTLHTTWLTKLKETAPKQIKGGVERGDR